MLGHWYFGCCLAMTRQRFQAFLSLLHTLEHNPLDEKLAIIASQQLQEADIWVRTYAVFPALCALRRSSREERLSVEIKRLVISLIEQVPEALRDRLRDVLNALPGISREQGVLELSQRFELAASAVLGARQISVGPRLRSPYLDIEGYLAETLLLGLLAATNEIDVKKAGNKLEEFLREGLAGRFGRCAFALAARTLLNRASPEKSAAMDVLEALRQLRSGDVFCEPDLAEILAYCLLSDPERPALEVLWEELASFYQYCELSLHAMRLRTRDEIRAAQRDALERMGMAYSPATASTLSLIFWHQALVRQAATKRVSGLPELLLRFWTRKRRGYGEEPNFRLRIGTKGMPQRFFSLLKVRLADFLSSFDETDTENKVRRNVEDAGGLSNGSPSALCHLFSPWLPRKAQQNSAQPVGANSPEESAEGSDVEREESGAPRREPGMKPPHLIALVACTHVAENLLAGSQGEAVERLRPFAELLCHCVNRLQRMRWIMLRNSETSLWAEPIDGLIVSGWECAARAGAGLLPGVSPTMFFSLPREEDAKACLCFIEESYGFADPEEATVDASPIADSPSSTHRHISLGPWHRHVLAIAERHGRQLRVRATKPGQPSQWLNTGLVQRFLLSEEERAAIPLYAQLDEEVLQQGIAQIESPLPGKARASSRWLLLLTPRLACELYEKRQILFWGDDESQSERPERKPVVSDPWTRLIVAAVRISLLWMTYESAELRTTWRQRLLDELRRAGQRKIADRYLLLLLIELLDHPAVTSDEALQVAISEYLLDWGSAATSARLIECLFAPSAAMRRHGVSEARVRARELVFAALLRARSQPTVPENQLAPPCDPFVVRMEQRRHAILETGLLWIASAALRDLRSDHAEWAEAIFRLVESHYRQHSQYKERAEGLRWTRYDRGVLTPQTRIAALGTERLLSASGVLVDVNEQEVRLLTKEFEASPAPPDDHGAVHDLFLHPPDKRLDVLENLPQSRRKVRVAGIVGAIRSEGNNAGMLRVFLNIGLPTWCECEFPSGRREEVSEGMLGLAELSRKGGYFSLTAARFEGPPREETSQPAPGSLARLCIRPPHHGGPLAVRQLGRRLRDAEDASTWMSLFPKREDTARRTPFRVMRGLKNIEVDQLDEASWFADLSLAFDDSLAKSAHNTWRLCRFDGKHWQPLEKDLLGLLHDARNGQEQDGAHPFLLVIARTIRAAASAEDVEYICSLAPGALYRVFGHQFSPEDAALLQQRVADCVENYGTSCGLLISVCWDDEIHRLRLFRPEPGAANSARPGVLAPFDLRNIVFRTQLHLYRYQSAQYLEFSEFSVKALSDPESAEQDAQKPVTIRQSSNLSGWYIKLESLIPGFPEYIAVMGLPPRKDTPWLEELVEVLEWTLHEQLGIKPVKVRRTETYALSISGDASEADAQLEDWLNLDKDSICELAEVLQGDPSWNLYPCKTSIGALVRVHPESLSLSLKHPSHLQFSGKRLARVERMGRSLFDLKTHPIVQGETILRLLKTSEVVTGVLIRLPRPNEERRSRVTVAFRDSEGVSGPRYWFAEVDIPDLQGLPPSYRLSQGAVLRGARVEGQWVWTLEARSPIVSALFRRVQERPQGSMYIGEARFDDGRTEPVSLLEISPGLVAELDGARPALFSEWSQHGFQSLSDSDLENKSWTLSRLPTGRSARRGGISCGTRWLHGELRGADREGEYLLSEVMLFAEAVPNPEPLYCIRRSLSLSALSMPQPEREREEQQRRESELQRVLRGQRAIIADLSAGRANLCELTVPLAPAAEGATQQWTREVELVDQPYIEEARYRPRGEVCLFEEHGRIVASCQRTPPRNLLRFDKEFNTTRTAAGNFELHNQSFYYVGALDSFEPSPGDRAGGDRRVHVFEWGYGLRLEVAERQLTCMGKPLRNVHLTQLCHGDRIVKARIIKAGGSPKDWKLDLLEIAATYEDHRELFRQAQSNVLHTLHIVDRPQRPLAERFSIHSVLGLHVTSATDSLRAFNLRTVELSISSQEMLAATQQGEDAAPPRPRFSLLGRLDAEHMQHHRGARIRFHGVLPWFDNRQKKAAPQPESAAGSAPRSEHYLRPNNIVFLIAREICHTKNDVAMLLGLQRTDSIEEPFPPLKEGDLSVVKVQRREFSARADRLRRWLELGVDVRGRVFPVLIRNNSEPRRDRFGRILGSIPPRRLSVLHHLLKNAQRPVYAVVAQNMNALEGDELRSGRRMPSLLLEIYPAVFVSLPQASVDERSLPKLLQMRPGDIVLLRLTTVEEIALTQTSVSHTAFLLPGAPRLAVALPKNPLLVPRGKASAQKQHSGFPTSLVRNRGFWQSCGEITVSGLPEIEAKPEAGVTPDALCAFMQKNHPKLVELTILPGNVVEYRPLSTAAGRDSVAARVRWDGEPLAVLADGQELRLGEQLSLLSFADEPVKKLRERLLTASWVHHDHETGTWVIDGEQGTTRAEVLRPATPVREPLVFKRDGQPDRPDEGLRLRYADEDLLRFGFPVENLIASFAKQQGSTWLTREFVVAAGHRDGLWVELSPGRVSQLPGGRCSLQFGGFSHALDSFDWTLLCPGDRVELSLLPADEAGLDMLVLESYRSGPRAALARRWTALLPLADFQEKEGALVVGAGEFRVTMPALARPRQDVIELFPTGGYHGCDRSPRKGDVLLLILKQRGVRALAGFSQLRPVLSREVPQETSHPLHLLIAEGESNKLEEFLVAIGGSMAVVVRAVVEDRVYYNLDTLSLAVRPGCFCIGHAVAWLHHTNRVLLRVGATFVLARLEELVQGTPASLAEKIVESLRISHWPIAVRREANGQIVYRVSGQKDAGEFRVELFQTVLHASDALGVLVRSPSSGQLYFLPAPQATLAEELSEQEFARLLRHLAPDGSDGASVRYLTVCHLADGTLSAIATRRVQAALSTMQVGSEFTAVFLEHSNDGDLLWLPGLELAVRGTPEMPSGKEYPVEVISRTQGKRSSVRVVPLGQRTFKLDLPDQSGHFGERHRFSWLRAELRAVLMAEHDLPRAAELLQIVAMQALRSLHLELLPWLPGPANSKLTHFGGRYIQRLWDWIRVLQACGPTGIDASTLRDLHALVRSVEISGIDSQRSLDSDVRMALALGVAVGMPCSPLAFQKLAEEAKFLHQVVELGRLYALGPTEHCLPLLNEHLGHLRELLLSLEAQSRDIPLLPPVLIGSTKPNRPTGQPQ